MKKLLREHFKHLLKEEIDYSSKIATVYHLTGSKTAIYDDAYADKIRSTPSSIKKRIDDKRKDKRTSILAKAEYQINVKELERIKTRPGKAYHIAKTIVNDPWSLGSSFVSGAGDMYGKGLYTCYSFNPKIAQTYGDIILRFDVDISNFLIFNAGIAKKIHGAENFKLSDQFLAILKNKGFDLKRELESSDETIISKNSKLTLSNFIEYLDLLSGHQDFVNSTEDTSLRTAGLALSVLKNFSKRFGAGRYLKLRDIVDGIIFFGKGDGPVCLIYHPETLKTYNLTGAGYFLDKKPGEEVAEHFITSDIESLVGRTGTNLKDAFIVAKETDTDRKIIDDERTDNVTSLLKRFSDKSAYKSDLDAGLYEFLNQISTSIVDRCKKELTPEIITARFNSTPNLTNLIENINKSYMYLQFSPSVLIEPFLNFIEIYGPGLEIITQGEFQNYCRIFKKLCVSNIRPTIKDFERNNLKCITSNQEELDNITNSREVKTLCNKYNYLKNSSGIADDFVELGSSIFNVDYREKKSFNNKLLNFNLDFIELNLESDREIITNFFKEKLKVEINNLKNTKNNAKMSKKMKKDLSYWFDDNNYESAYDSLGNISLEKVVNHFKYMSDLIDMTGTLLYNFCDVNLATKSFYDLTVNSGKLNDLKLDSTKFNLEFILSEMYNCQSSDNLEGICSMVAHIFKDGEELFKSNSYIDNKVLFDKIKKEKTDNLLSSLEDMFIIHNFKLSREKVEI